MARCRGGRTLGALKSGAAPLGAIRLRGRTRAVTATVVVAIVVRAARVTGVRGGAIPYDDLLVHGTRDLLKELKRRGLALYLASGTDEQFVKQEAELLQVTEYFGKHIYGAQDDYKKFSKKMVIERLLKENAIPGDKLLAFGDGYVEILNTKEVGGLAVAVASDEAHNGSGQFDEWKRQRLIGVGADVVIPDYRDAKPLLDLILGT